jgi:hypothetical protein
MASSDTLGQRAGLRRSSPRRRQDPDQVELERYSFRHRPYEEIAYYDQPVFKRHAPIPPAIAATADGKS